MSAATAATAATAAAYVRTRSGRVVHRTGCRHLHRATYTLWPWAAGKPLELLDVLAAEEAGIRYRYCHTCIPDCPRYCTSSHDGRRKP